MNKIEKVFSGQIIEIEVCNSLEDLAKELMAHRIKERNQGRDHGVNCACMDRFITAVRNFVSEQSDPKVKDRMVYILKRAVAHL